jgi:hypothetical protein
VSHKCPAPDCDVSLQGAQLMCPPHWRQVPRPLQQEVYAAWNHGRGIGTERHWRAVRAAKQAVTP